MNWIRTIFLGYFLVSSASALGNGPAEHRYVLTTEKSYADVMEDLDFAIGEHNFRRTSRNAIGKAIEERLDQAFPEATVVHFCNMEYAKILLDANPDYLLHLPCRISAWQDKRRVRIEARLLPMTDPEVAATVDQINRILMEIVDYAAE